MSPTPPRRRPDALSTLLRHARRSGDYSQLTEAIPYARFLGVVLESDGQGLLCRMRYSPRLIGNPLLPALHGGTLGGLLELAAAFEVMVHTDTEHVPKPVTLTVDYLRSGRPQDTLARASITRQGRSVVNVRVEAWQDERQRPIAAAHAIFLLVGG